VNISGIVVACRPEDLAETAEAVDALPWAEVHYTDPRGRLVATLEAADTDESVARLQEVQALPRVLMAELAGYYLDEEAQPDPVAPDAAPLETDSNSSRRIAERRREGET
jgi:nitrate reductase NapAB chaperone NapD